MVARVLLGCVGAAVLLAGGCGPARLTTDVVVKPAVKDDPLAQEFARDPIAYLESGLAWCNAHIKDYTCTLYKLERIDPDEKDFRPEQELKVEFKESPFSIFVHVTKHARGAYKTLYVEGQWDNKMKARTMVPLLGTLQFDPRGPEARRQTLRFIDQFGFKRSLEQMVSTLKVARSRSAVQFSVEGVGEVPGVELPARKVLIIEYRVDNSKLAEPLEYPHLRVYLDREWRLPLEVNLWDGRDIERGRYRMTDVRFNTGLTDDDFTLKAHKM